VDSVRQNDVRLLAGHHRRFNPLVKVTRHVIRKGKIGKLVAQLKHFRKVVRGKEEPKTTGEDALRSLAVALAVLKSEASGDPVELPH
jgi:predicted dehydrogenase